MLQVMASNHPGPTIPNLGTQMGLGPYGARESYGLMAYPPGQNLGIWRNLDRRNFASVEPVPLPAKILLDPKPQAWDST